ncbi:PREDICTED: oxysterol-binding protein-related protein 1-like [Acropora digitifera]|uniref:oxysterol-binding protein-related protein 1-like n=1 Tax=Acropora digitifera TaxID=70779 RepID=UPI00077AA755|nr:PREDICTED: oxysterol-binding protein-related protein 1-like [Acropora digitifera]
MSSFSKKEEKEEKLLQSSRRGDLNAVLSLLEVRSPKNGPKNIDVNCKGRSKANQGWTPLHLAAYFGHKDVVRALLEVNNIVQPERFFSGYSGFPFSPKTNISKFQFDQESGRQRTTSWMCYLLWSTLMEVVTLLIEHEADVTIINGEGRKPSQVTNSSEVKHLIKAAERSLELKLEEHLLTAAREGDVSELKKLIDSVHPPNINCQDVLGNTPLHCAAYRLGNKITAHFALCISWLMLGQLALGLASNKKMKQLLDVQPLQRLHKVASRHEGLLLKRSRFFGWKKFWVVLERGVLSYFSKRADAATSMKRQGYKYLDHCKFSVPRDEKFKIKIQYSDNTVQIWSIAPNEKTPQVQRQRWLNSLHEHCAYSTFYTTQPTLLIDDQENDLVPLGNVQDSLKSAKAHQQLLNGQVDGVNTTIAEVTNSPNSAQTNKGKVVLLRLRSFQPVSTALGNCNALVVFSFCLFIFPQFVSAFAISATASNLDRVGKPFNPLLGETYELIREDMGFKLVAEQVSHHPPVSALQVISEDFVFHVTVQPKMKFWGKGIEIQPKGVVTLKFPKHNEVYTWNNVNTCVHNIIVGQLWIEQVSNFVSSRGKRIFCFPPKAQGKPRAEPAAAKWLLIDRDDCAKGYKPITELRNVGSKSKRKRFIIRGDWTDRIQCFAVDKFNKKDFKRESKRRRSDGASEADAKDSTSAASLESFSSGSSDGSATVDTSAAKDLWRFQERPPNSKQMYNFTTYAMQLNELREDQKSQVIISTVPCSAHRTPCELSFVTIDAATREKIRLEEKQRSARKERSKNERWIPRWFKEDINPYTGQLDWLFTNTYWNRNWASCPDIF